MEVKRHFFFRKNREKGEKIWKIEKNISNLREEWVR